MALTFSLFGYQMRLKGFKDALRSGDSVTQAIHTAGFGSTSRVYGATTRNIGMTPRAYRAGGANRIAVLVPCHRVLRSDGSLGGYRWGTERKRALLDAERTRRLPS